MSLIFDWRKLRLKVLKAICVEPAVIAARKADGERLSSADLVLWNCGNDTTDTLSLDNRSALANYLDSCGNLLVVSPGLPAELFKGGDRS